MRSGVTMGVTLTERVGKILRIETAASSAGQIHGWCRGGSNLANELVQDRYPEVLQVLDRNHERAGAANHVFSVVLVERQLDRGRQVKLSGDTAIWVLPHIACFGWDDCDRMSR